MQIKLNYLKAANVVSGDDKHRPQLEGVHVSVIAQHVEYVATDGARLIALRHELSTDSACVWPAAGVIVPSALIERIKLAKRADDTAEITVVNNLVTISYRGETFAMPAIDYTFPEWRRVVPDKVSGEVAHFNAQYLADFSKAAKLLGHNIECPLIGHNGVSAALIDFLGGRFETGFGVLMPHRECAAPSEAPSWVKPQSSAVAA
jgi:DNA polymerase III subunit beta